MAPNKNTINNNEFTVLLARLTAATALPTEQWYKYLAELSNLQHTYEFADTER